jgi:serine/threonine-protein kinase HipA
MRRAAVLYKDEEAGVLTQFDDGRFAFTYLEAWVENPSKPPVSLTLPKTKEAYNAAHLFPFFHNMLPEGSNREVVCMEGRIDRDDYFGILMATANTDVIGAVQVIEIVAA